MSGSMLARVLAFLGIVGGISAVIHGYLWARLVRDPAWPESWTRVGTVAFVVLAIAPIAAMAATVAAPRAVAAPLAWVAMTWMGLVMYLVLVLGGADLVRVGVAAAHEGIADPERRTFLARSLAAFATGTASVFGLVGVREALAQVAVKPIRIGLRKLPPSMSGTTIVQLTDVHVGPTIGRAFVERIVERTNALAPDVVAITGDLVDGSVAELASLVEPLRDLRAKHGVFFVTGNHEYYSGADAWIAHLESLGIRVLRNERVAIGGHEGFDLAGVDDFRAHDFGHGHGADLGAALRGRDPSRALVLLAHQPKAAIEAAEKGVDLQISGHTHGGQMVPFNALVALEQPYVQGLHRRGDLFVYVSAGTGYWGPPMRVGVPAEITRIELVTDPS